MPRNFNIGSLVGQLGLKKNDPRTTARVGLGALLVCNLVAAWFVYSPIGGSADEMESRLLDLQRQVSSKQAVLRRSKELAAKVDKGRMQGDEFLGRYFLSRPTTYSTLVGELNTLAKAAGVRPKEQAFNEEEVEGSDELGMVSITAGYEGSYADLLHFLRELDKANRLVIIESLAASPQQGTGVLNISLRLNTFIREVPVEAQLAALTQPGGSGVPPGATLAPPVAPAAEPSPAAVRPRTKMAQPGGAVPPPAGAPAPPSGTAPSLSGGPKPQSGGPTLPSGAPTLPSGAPTLPSGRPTLPSGAATLPRRTDATTRRGDSPPRRADAGAGPERSRTMKLGATPKQIAILVGLVLVALYFQFSGDDDGRPKSDAKRGPAPVAAPLPVSGSAGPRTVTTAAARNAAAPRPNSRNRTSLEYKPVLRPRRVEDRVDPTTIDPTLRTDILAKLATIQIQGGSRNRCLILAPHRRRRRRIPGKIAVKPGAVKPPPVVISPVKPPSAPGVTAPVKPQAPPIPLKFYGFTSARAGLKRAFFLEGEDVYVANEGDIVKKRYKVVRVNLNSVVMEDTEYKQQQTLPLTEQSQ